MTRARHHLLFCFSLFIPLLGTPFFAHGAMAVVAGTPAGFETLEAPRATTISLYYGGELLGNFRGKFSPKAVAFTAPLDIMTAIPTINDPGAVGSALSSPLPSNTGLVCGTKPREGCGQLKPDVVGIIFDEDHLSAELFINPHYLQVTEENAARYLPLPDRHFSSVYRFEGAVSGTDEATPNFALNNTAIHAFGEGNLATDTSITNRGLRFNQASAEVEREGWGVAGGLMRSAALQLAGDRDIAGVSLSTSTRTRLDVRKTEGNALLVYLPRQAFVSIYRERRLYSSHNYDAGNQRLDTTELPNGAYNVTLKIQEAGGDSREETRFFAKSEQIPPPDAPTYYLQGGVIRVPASQDSVLPELTDKPILQVGTVRRVDANVGLSVGALGLSDRVAMETSLFRVGADTQLRATALASSAGDVGLQTNLLYVKSQWSAALDARKLWAGDSLSRDYSGLISGIEQANGSLTYNVNPALDVSLRGGYSAPDAMPLTASFGPEVNWRLWQEGESMLTLSANAAHVSGEDQAAVFARFSYKFGENGITGESGISKNGTNSGPYGAARVWHNKVTAGDALLAGVGVQADGRTQNISADADWRTNFGRVSGAVQQGIGGQNVTNYGGNFAVGAAQTDDLVHLGGNEADMSAVVIETAGDAEATMTIYINSSPRGTVKVGERQVIYLAPYGIYRVHLVPSHAGLVHIEGGERKATLCPGNVVRMSWQVNRFTVVAGRVVQANGAPLAGATLEASKGKVVTDTKGRFQAELAVTDPLIFSTAQGTSCQVTLPNIAEINGVRLYKQPLLCR